MNKLKKMLGVAGLVLVLFLNGFVFADEPILTLKGHNKDINSVAFSPDGSMIASGSSDGTIKLWDVKKVALLKTLKNGNKHSDSINSIAFSPDGTIIASGGFMQKLKLWSIDDGSIIYEYKESKSLYSSVTDIKSIAYSPDSTKIACTSGTIGSVWKAKNGGLWLLDTKTRKIKTLSKKEGGYCVTFSPDGTMIASGSRHWTIKLWNVQNGTLLRTLKGHNGHVKSVAFSPDGSMIASGSSDDTIKLWDVQNGTLLHTLKVNNRSLFGILSVAFSPDGSMIASGSSDGIIKLWDVQNGTLLGTLKGHNYQVKSVAFSPDGMMIVSGSSSGIIKLWDTNPYNESLANQIYKSIDKSNYIALYEFIKKFYNKFDIVQQSYRDIYKAVIKENTTVSYAWYIYKITNSKSAMKKLIDLTKEEDLKMYKSVVNENNILAYKWYVDEYFANGKKLAKKSIFKLITKQNTVAGYEWFILQYPDSKEVKDAINSLYKLTFEKAKEINTVTAYNTFIFAYPYASQVKEANKLAYELEKEKYIDLGTMGFFGKDEKMNKQARKILIKTKQILNKNSLGSRIVVERMYNLVQNEFPDTDATLSFLESFSVYKFKKEISNDVLNATENTSGKDEKLFQRVLFMSVVDGAKNVFKSPFSDKKIVAFYNESTESFKKYLAEEENKIKPYIKSKEKEISDRRVKRVNEIKEKTFNFEKRYKKAIGEYKSEVKKWRNVSIEKATRVSQDLKEKEREIATKKVSVLKEGQTWRGWYDCSQGKTALDLKIEKVSGNEIRAIFDFNYKNGRAIGQFELSGQYNPYTKKLEFTPLKWLNNPNSYGLVGMLGEIYENRSFVGKITGLGCTDFEVVLQKKPVF